MRRPPRRTRLSLLLCVIAFTALAACSRQPDGGGETSGSPGSTPGGAASAPSSSPGGAGGGLEPVMTLEAQSVFERSCKNCHGPDGHGIAAVAPDLRRSPRRSVEEWEKYLRDPNSVHPNSNMPAVESLTDEDYEAVAVYLADLTQHNPLPGGAGQAK
jgi:mono/diheme cytochrome c family protein